MDQEQPFTDIKLRLKLQEDEEAITLKMETDERNDFEEKSLSEMQIQPNDPCTSISNNSDGTVDEQKICLPSALAGRNNIENCIVMEPADEDTTHPQTTNDSQISDPNILKTEQHQSEVGDRLEKDSFVIIETKEIVEVNTTDGSKDVESKTTDENVKEKIFEIDFKSKEFLYQASGSWAEFDQDDDCFLKGCKWSPDGLCLLTNSDDNALRIFNLPTSLQGNDTYPVCEDMVPALKMNEGETIYDFSWYPYMTSYDPSTCCLIATSRDHPIHLWDAFTGQIRCSYLAYNHLDELVAANSVAFNPDGSKIYCGFNKIIRVFDSARPGRECEEYATIVKRSKLKQSGIISCISFTNQPSSMFALGSFAKSVGIYSERTADLICMLPGQNSGVTQVQFSKDGYHVYAGARKDEDINCWDLRSPYEKLFTFKRKTSTNQRIQFDVHWSDRYLVSGNTNGFISFWDLTDDHVDGKETQSFHAHHDVVNGLSLHPYLPLIASTSGQRHFNISGTSSDSDDSTVERIDNSLRIWKYNLKSGNSDT